MKYIGEIHRLFLMITSHDNTLTTDQVISKIQEVMKNKELTKYEIKQALESRHLI